MLIFLGWLIGMFLNEGSEVSKVGRSLRIKVLQDENAQLTLRLESEVLTEDQRKAIYAQIAKNSEDLSALSADQAKYGG